jgi:hypothetical protein
MVAVISADPFTGTIVVLLKRVTVDPDGAVNGTLSHAVAAMSASHPTTSAVRRRGGGVGNDDRDGSRAGAIMALKALTRIASWI